MLHANNFSNISAVKWDYTLSGQQLLLKVKCYFMLHATIFAQVVLRGS